MPWPAFFGAPDADELEELEAEELDDEEEDEDADASEPVEPFMVGALDDYWAYVGGDGGVAVGVSRMRTEVGGWRLPPNEVVVAVVAGPSFPKNRAVFVCTRAYGGRYATWRRFRVDESGRSDGRVEPIEVTHMVPRAWHENPSFNLSTCDEFVTADGLCGHLATIVRTVPVKPVGADLSVQRVPVDGRRPMTVTATPMPSQNRSGYSMRGVIVRQNESGDLVRVDGPDTEVLASSTRITSPIVQSPDGLRLAFVTNNNRVWLVDDDKHQWVSVPHVAFSAYVDRFEGGNTSVVLRSAASASASASVSDAWLVRFD